SLGAVPVTLEKLLVYPPARGYWGAHRSGQTVTSGFSVALTPLDPAYPDALRQVYGAANPGDGSGVRVAIVDCGVGPHPDLNVAGGLNVVEDEDPNDIADNGNGHGTHVAGIIAGSLRGIAPAAELYSYRVVGKAGQPASNYLI